MTYLKLQTGSKESKVYFFCRTNKVMGLNYLHQIFCKRKIDDFLLVKISITVFFYLFQVAVNPVGNMTSKPGLRIY